MSCPSPPLSYLQPTTMSSRTNLLVVAFASYALAWLVIYGLIMWPDFTYIPEYFVYAWMFGGDIPQIINAGAILISIASTGVFLVARRYIAGRR